MAATSGVVIPLSGEEGIMIALDAVEKALRRDCNLRPTDAYPGGISGKIVIDLNLHGMDVTPAHFEVEIGEPGPLDENAVNVRSETDIVLNPDLDAVRKEVGIGVPMQVLDSSTGKTAVKRRSYARTAGAPADDTESL